MWIKIIMLLISIFMIYHLYYDFKIWSNGGPLIEGMDNEEKVSDDVIDEEQEKQNDEDELFRDTVKRAAKAAAEAAAGEFLDSYVPEQPGGTPQNNVSDSTVQVNQAGSTDSQEAIGSANETDSGISANVTINYCDVIDENTVDTVLAQKNLIPEEMDINVYNKDQVVRVGNNFIEILKNVRNLHNVPSMKESDLETLGISVINLQNKKSDNTLKKEIIQNVCSMISGIHSNSVDWDTPKLEIKQTTTGMFNDNSNVKFNQGETATENSTKLEEQGLCLWKGCQKGLGQPTDSVWSLY